MAINISYQPPAFQPVLANGLFYTISADTTDTFKFRYTYDIYVEGQNIFQGKATPNPYGLGVIDVSRILKTYVANNPISLWNNTPIYTHQTFPFSRPYQDETVYYQTYFGYEYADSELSPVTGFTGLGLSADTQGNPSVPSSIAKVFQSTMGVNGRATQQNFNMDPFVLSGSPVGTNPSTSGLFLTNSPRTRNIQDSEWYTLAFTNYYLTQSVLSEPYYVEYKMYDDQGTFLSAVTIDNLTINGGGPRPSCTSVYQSYIGLLGWGDTNYQTLYVGAGPRNMQSILHPDTKQYTVQLFGKFTGSTSPLIPSPTPTPTPSSTPRTCACPSFIVENPSLESLLIFNWLDCDRINRTLEIEPSQSFAICMCNTGDYNASGSVILTLSGTCASPTPTPTPSALPCNCESGEIYNPNSYSIQIDAESCDGITYSIIIDAFDTILTACLCSNKLSSVSPFIFVATASCAPTPTPTPTSGLSPTPTPTPTTTPSPTPPFQCPCFQMEITNPNGFSILVTGVDCNNNPVSFSISAGQTVFTDCICSDSLSSESPFNAVTSVACVTPTPTPTLTRTPTSTPQALPPEMFNINECDGGCQGGECQCDSLGNQIVYMASGLSPSDIGENIYSDPGLTTLWYGFYSYSGSIYEASAISFVCVIGGPC